MRDVIADGPGATSAGRRGRIHRAWWVAAITFAALLAAASFRSSTGVLIEPLEAEFGWSRALTSGAITVNFILYGLTAPFAAALMQRFGVRGVVVAALVLIATGMGLTTLMTSGWQLYALWGLCVGLGTGALALVFGAIVANRWFLRHRGLMMGAFSAASATGQLVFLPVIANLTENVGWRQAALLVAALALLLIPFVLALLAESPAAVGLRPYGDPETGELSTVAPPSAKGVEKGNGAARTAIRVLREASHSATFWILMGTFFICGWSTNGLIQTHFIPAAHDHGMPPTTAAGLLAVIGAFDILGTLASGWLTDRVDSRKLLLAYYGLRGLSLLVVPAVLGPTVEPPLFFFIVFYGLDWVATVPPTVALCRQHFGLERSGIVFGWVFGAHMVGAGVAASVAGLIRTNTGDYAAAWYAAGLLCVIAAFAVLRIPRPPIPETAPSAKTDQAAPEPEQITLG
ncbi:MAG: MFS transporter, partial [Geodermatophilaceae bacterium]|nr:MFS transporter [Geodermatophilaceae bacterium]